MAKIAMSPLVKLLCSLFLFSSNVLAISAVIGIDLGTEYLKATLVKPGIPLDIVLTKDSRRKEASAVAFKRPQNGPKPGEYPERAYGSDAMALTARFPGDVYPNLKALLGLPTDASVVTEYAVRHPALQLGTHKLRNTVTFKSGGAFSPEDEGWMVEELLAMELQSIQKSAEDMAGSTVRSAVITVPPFYTLEERRATETAADLAGLKVLSLISDGLAVGLNYATSRTFPNINQGGKAEHHMVFDMGAGSTTATVLRMQSRQVKDIGKFNKTVQEVQVLGSGWDRTLGGDALNYLIMDDMVTKFAESPKAKKASVTVQGVKAHGRAIAKLSKEAERIKHVLSANLNTGASFEDLYEEVDFKYKIERVEFEKMAHDHIGRVSVAVKSALETAGIDIADLDSVILAGGATRTPFVQRELEKLFGAEKLRANVNADESAVFGAGFRAAEISPSFRVKEIRVSDGVSYAAGMKYDNHNGKPTQQRLWSARSQLGGPAKEVTLTNKEDFEIDFYQQVPPLPPATGPDVDAPTAKLITKNLTATVAELKDKYTCEASDIQFKFSVKLSGENGEIEVTKATVQCETDAQEKKGVVDGVKNLFGFGKKEDQKPIDGEGADGDSSSSASSKSSKASKSSASTTSGSASASESPEASIPKKKLVVIPVKVELVKAGIPQLSKAELKESKDRLKAFEASDKARRQREEALNQLEGFTYKVRDLLDNDDFTKASTAEERTRLQELSEQESEWIYDGGADAPKEELKRRLKGLTDIVDPIQSRIEEAKKRPELVKGLQEALVQTEEFVASIKKNMAEYDAFKSAEAAASSSSTTETSSSATPEATAKDEFADLEDSDAKASKDKKEDDTEGVTKERGPVPPMYTMEDLTEVEDLQKKISPWLAEKLKEQSKLAETSNPVLTIKELTMWRTRLDKAGMDLTMKGVKNFEKKKKQDEAAKKKQKKASAGKSDKPVKIELGKDGKMPTQEELEELLKQYAPPEAEREDKKPEDKKIKHEEL